MEDVSTAGVLLRVGLLGFIERPPVHFCLPPSGSRFSVEARIVYLHIKINFLHLLLWFITWFQFYSLVSSSLPSLVMHVTFLLLFLQSAFDVLCIRCHISLGKKIYCVYFHVFFAFFSHTLLFVW